MLQVISLILILHLVRAPVTVTSNTEHEPFHSAVNISYNAKYFRNICYTDYSEDLI